MAQTQTLILKFYQEMRVRMTLFRKWEITLPQHGHLERLIHTPVMEIK